MSLDEYVIFNKKILKLVGLHPFNLLRYLACIFSMLLIAVPQMVQLYLSRNDISILLETSSVFLTILLAVLKSIFWLKNDETSRLVEFFLTDYWRIAESVDANNRMQGYAKLGRKMTRGYSFLILNSLIAFFTLQPLKSVVIKLQGSYEVDGEKSFPFAAKYPKFCYESPFYEITYGSQALATGHCGLMILAMDTLIATALFHTCGYFKVLHDNLSTLDSYVDQLEYPKKINIGNITKYSHDISGNLSKRLATLVDHHRMVVRFSDWMEKTFNPIMFLQVTASSLLICLVGFQVSSMTSENDRLVEYISYLVMALFQILLFCWPGDELIRHSSMIGEAAYSIKWYNTPNNMKVEICLIILRSQKPNCLTAGKLSKMCMESFAVILHTSLSYFMLLRSINSE